MDRTHRCMDRTHRCTFHRLYLLIRRIRRSQGSLQSLPSLDSHKNGSLFAYANNKYLTRADMNRTPSTFPNGAVIILFHSLQIGAAHKMEQKYLQWINLFISQLNIKLFQHRSIKSDHNWFANRQIN